MKGVNVPNKDSLSPRSMLDEMSGKLSVMTPEVRKVATYILDNPNAVGVCSVREIADAARVKPNTVVRMAQSVGFSGYEDFRKPFREQIRSGQVDFLDRAIWLQSLSKGGKLSSLYADLAKSAIVNIENTFASADAIQMKEVADAVVRAKRVYILGVGVNSTLANGFAYLGDMARNNFIAIPKNGSNAIDDLARATEGDVLIAMTFKPYRAEVVRAVEVAKQQNVTVTAISDSLASPIVTASDYKFIVHTDTPQFFPSTVAAAALLEAMMAFVIAGEDQEATSRIEQIHARRYSLQIYETANGEMS